MLTFLYCMALAEIILDDSVTGKVLEKRIATLNRVYARANAYEKEGFDSAIVVRILEQKIEHIKAATTIKDLDIICKICEVSYLGDGRFVPKHPAFHVIEEELIQWSMASLKAPPGRYAVKRMGELFPLVFPDAENIFKGL